MPARRTSRSFFVVVMASLLAFQPLTAAAQVGGYTEHEWTVDVGGATFGLRQEFILDGGYRHTRVFLGCHDFHTRLLAMHILGAVLTLVTLVLVFASVRIVAARRRYATQ